MKLVVFGFDCKEASWVTANRAFLRSFYGFYGVAAVSAHPQFLFALLEFLCNARNGLTRIASYLRKPMTKQCIKILIKENSMN
jgi:hypothetical protein